MEAPAILHILEGSSASSASKLPDGKAGRPACADMLMTQCARWRMKTSGSVNELSISLTAWKMQILHVTLWKGTRNVLGPLA